MPDLADDIARVAALRGRNAEALIERAHSPAARLNQGMVASIFKPGPNPTQDLRWYDELPPKSRAFIRERPEAINSAAWAWNLHECGDEDALIAAVSEILAKR